MGATSLNGTSQGFTRNFSKEIDYRLPRPKYGTGRLNHKKTIKLHEYGNYRHHPQDNEADAARHPA